MNITSNILRKVRCFDNSDLTTQFRDTIGMNTIMLPLKYLKLFNWNVCYITSGSSLPDQNRWKRSTMTHWALNKSIGHIHVGTCMCAVMHGKHAWLGVVYWAEQEIPVKQKCSPRLCVFMLCVYKLWSSQIRFEQIQILSGCLCHRIKFCFDPVAGKGGWEGENVHPF